MWPFGAAVIVSEISLGLEGKKRWHSCVSRSLPNGEKSKLSSDFKYYEERVAKHRNE